MDGWKGRRGESSDLKGEVGRWLEQRDPDGGGGHADVRGELSPAYPLSSPLAYDEHRE